MARAAWSAKAWSRFASSSVKSWMSREPTARPPLSSPLAGGGAGAGEAPGAAPPEPVSQILAEGQLLILEDVAREDGAALDYRAGHQSVTRPEEVPGLEEAKGRAAPADGPR